VPSLPVSWDERSFYANKLKDIIKDLDEKYHEQKVLKEKLNIAKTCGYLTMVVAKLINDEKQIEERISKLEELAGIGQKGKLTK